MSSMAKGPVLSAREYKSASEVVVLDVALGAIGGLGLGGLDGGGRHFEEVSVKLNLIPCDFELKVCRRMRTWKTMLLMRSFLLEGAPVGFIYT